MSRRRVLNITTTKKQDNRLLFENLTTPANPPVQNIAAPISANNNYIMPYMPTAMDRSNASFLPSLSYRERQDIFVRGYKERVKFTFGNGSEWQWRRVVFRMKGPSLTDLQTATVPLWQEVTGGAGFVRTITQANGTPLGTAIAQTLFKGTVNLDWQDFMTAKVDTQRVTLVSDRTRQLRGGNGEPRLHAFNLWYPLNKLLRYNDDEAGNTEVESKYSTAGKPGMGDLYIIDFLTCATNGAAVQGNIQVEGTLYWHER